MLFNTNFLVSSIGWASSTTRNFLSRAIMPTDLWKLLICASDIGEMYTSIGTAEVSEDASEDWFERDLPTIGCA